MGVCLYLLAGHQGQIAATSRYGAAPTKPPHSNADAAGLTQLLLFHLSFMTDKYHCSDYVTSNAKVYSIEHTLSTRADPQGALSGRLGLCSARPGDRVYSCASLAAPAWAWNGIVQRETQQKGRGPQGHVWPASWNGERFCSCH